MQCYYYKQESLVFAVHSQARLYWLGKNTGHGGFVWITKATVSHKYLIPVIEEPLVSCTGLMFSPSSASRWEYHQNNVHEGDIPKTAFRPHECRYDFLVMLFGTYGHIPNN